MFHKNIKTVAGCLSRVTCVITAPEGVDKTLTAFLVYEGESRPATLESADVIIFPAVPYGHYAYEIRCGGKPVAFGHLLARPSAFPHSEGVVDYTLEADLSATEAAQIELTLTPGPRGPKGEDGDPTVFAALVAEHADDATAHVTPEERTAWNAAAAGGGVSEDAVASIVGSTFKLAVGSNVPTASAGDGSIALGGRAEGRGIAVGCQSVAEFSTDAIAIGYMARGYGSNGVCIGTGSFCGGEMAIAIGSAADAATNDGVAIGTRVHAIKEGSIALGLGCNSNGAHSIAIGYENTAGGAFCTVIGAEAHANSNNCLLLAASAPYSNVAMTMELMAEDLKSVPGGNGEVGDPYLSFSGGKLRFALVDRLAGKMQAMTIKAVDLWRMLHEAGAYGEFLDEGYYG